MKKLCPVIIIWLLATLPLSGAIIVVNGNSRSAKPIAAAGGGGSIAVDASSPIRWTGTILDNGSSITSASFTAPANSFLVVFVEYDAGAGNDWILSASDSSTLTWTKQVERSGTETTSGGGCVIFTAVAASSTARTISIARADDPDGGTKRLSAKCYVVTGADISGTVIDTVGANNEGGSGTNNLTTTSLTPGADGILFAGSCEWNALGAFEASSNLTQDTANYSGEISVCDGYRTVSNGVGATANLNAAGSGTAQHKWCQIIVRKAP